MVEMLAAPARERSADGDTAEIAAPAVRAVNATLRRAVAAQASDIHVEPDGGGRGRIRLRIDGMLRTVDAIDADLYAAYVSRIKFCAGMDIANRRCSQDGRYSLSIAGRHIDARVASIPTIDGEKLAIRLFDHHAALPRLDELGIRPADLHAYRRATHAPWGFVVVSGPTGSGKTTTLYASLAELDRSARNVCTVEDPIEARLPDVTQVQVNLRAGLTFPGVLRSFMRQDPDVIMIGEMRDAETVAVGMSAALAGQAVFATVHSNDAARTLDRLIELGVARTSLAAGLTAILAQRLLRKLCRDCRRAAAIPAELQRAFPAGAATWYVAAACTACGGTGYRGRTGVFELLVIDDTLRDAIASGSSSAAIARLAAQQGHRSLRDDALTSVLDGTTSFAEIERVVGWSAAS
jgi:type IV pilus assembly protein PilB